MELKNAIMNAVQSVTVNALSAVVWNFVVLIFMWLYKRRVHILKMSLCEKKTPYWIVF
jgi:hypothetical protein